MSLASEGATVIKLNRGGQRTLGRCLLVVWFLKNRFVFTAELLGLV